MPDARASARRIRAPRRRARRAPACGSRPRHAPAPRHGWRRPARVPRRRNHTCPPRRSRSAAVPGSPSRPSADRPAAPRRRARTPSPHPRRPPRRPHDAGSPPARRASPRPAPDYAFVMSPGNPCHSSGQNHLYSTMMSVASSTSTSPRRRPRRKVLTWAFVAVFLLPVFGALGALAARGGPTHWSQWDRNVASQLGDAVSHPEARILVMSGRTRGWKGALAVHSWVVIKHENDRTWSRYDVAGWGDPVRLNWWPPDLGSVSAARSWWISRARRPRR